MKGIRNVLFDLDGTLTDPAAGIVRCIQYSLETLGLRCPDAVELESYIGPPLRRTFGTLCQTSDVAYIERAVSLYRERFSTVGLFENAVYAGVPQMLADLRAASYRLFVATSKPKVYAERILRHFSLEGYFVEVCGSELDGRFEDKAELLLNLLERHGLAPRQTVMVGDRKEDVLAARRNALPSLGITYGYGSEEELLGAGADHLCRNPPEVVSQIIRMGTPGVRRPFLEKLYD
ncbi:MAG: HAD hydrolase-like protein [Acidobacteria bacterium]|nr:HAD hydrolase-like protein [Acidobacteriota bacterium]